MADENDNAASVHEEGLDFAQMIIGDDTPPSDTPPVETPPTETPPVETPPEEVPPVETPPVVAEEDENPFKVESKEGETKSQEEIPEKPGTPDAWSRLRESRDRHKAAAEEKEVILREKEAEVADLKAKAARTAELEEKLKVFDEQEKELAVARVESTREYKESIEAPLQAIGKQVEVLVKSNEGDVSAVHRMLTEVDPAVQRTLLKEITSGWDEIDRLDLRKMADDTRTILDKQDAMRTNAHAAQKEREQIAAKREAEQKEVTKKEFVAAAGDAVKSVRDRLPFVPLAEGETEEDRYSSLEQKVAQVDFEVQTHRAKALAVASTIDLTHAIKTIGVKDTEIASLKEALAKAAKDKPSVVTKTETEESGSEDKDFFDAVGVPQPRHMFGPV